MIAKQLIIITLLIVVISSQKVKVFEYDSQANGKDGLLSAYENDDFNIQSDYVFYQSQVPVADVSKIVDYGVAFWYRWTAYKPKYGFSKKQVNLFSIFGATEKPWENYLLHYQKPPTADDQLSYGLQYGSLAKGGINDEVYQSLDIVDVDNSWNFFYIGYSSSKKSIVYFIKGGYTGEIKHQIFDSIEQAIPAKQLNFAVGSKDVQGCFFNFQFIYSDKPTILTKRSEVLNFLDTKAKVPPTFFDVGYKIEELVGSKEITRPKHQNTNSVFNTDGFYMKHMKNAADFAIHGFAKWTASEESKRQQKNSKVYKVSAIRPFLQSGSNVNFGDKLLDLEWNHLECKFKVTSSFCKFTDSCTDKIVSKEIEVQDCSKVENWFWFYHGYSHYTKKSTLYIKFSDSEFRVEQQFTNFIPNLFFIQLGQDKYAQTFWGMFKHVYLRVGPNAYKEYQYDESYQLAKDKTCAILYSECDYYGDYIEICKANPKMDPTFTVSSILIPPNKQIKLYNQENSQGSSVLYTKSQQCIDVIDFSAPAKILLQKGIKVDYNEESNNLVRNKENSQQAIFF